MLVAFCSHFSFKEPENRKKFYLQLVKEKNVYRKFPQREVSKHMYVQLYAKTYFLLCYCFRICTCDVDSRHTKVFHPTRLLPHEIQNSYISWLVYSRV